MATTQTLHSYISNKVLMHRAANFDQPSSHGKLRLKAYNINNVMRFFSPPACLSHFDPHIARYVRSKLMEDQSRVDIVYSIAAGYRGGARMFITSYKTILANGK
jgi:hypothetical protein